MRHEDTRRLLTLYELRALEIEFLQAGRFRGLMAWEAFDVASLVGLSMPPWVSLYFRRAGEAIRRGEKLSAALQIHGSGSATAHKQRANLRRRLTAASWVAQFIANGHSEDEAIRCATVEINSYRDGDPPPTIWKDSTTKNAYRDFRGAMKRITKKGAAYYDRYAEQYRKQL